MVILNLIVSSVYNILLVQRFAKPPAMARGRGWTPKVCQFVGEDESTQFYLQLMHKLLLGVPSKDRKADDTTTE
jgi:hypothetical protein